MRGNGSSGVYRSRLRPQRLHQDPALREERLVEARDLALKAKDIDPNIANIYVTLAICAKSVATTRGRDVPSETGLSLGPKEPIQYANLADDYLGGGEPAKAIELLTKASAWTQEASRDVICSSWEARSSCLATTRLRSSGC